VAESQEEEVMIYFMAKEGTDNVKIGWSVDVDQRRRQLTYDNGFDINVIRTIDGEPWVELWFHWRFSDSWLHHEWFTFHPEMLTIEPPNEKPTPFPKNRSKHEYDPAKPRQKAPPAFILPVRVDEELKLAIEAAAEKDNRSVAKWMRITLMEALKRK
jgi:hypothetical protein